MAAPSDGYVRRARLKRVVDGDTLDVVIDLGYRVSTTQRLRLLGIDTPEVRGTERPHGLASKLWAELWLAQAAEETDNPLWPLTVTSAKAGKYGRWLATITRDDGRNLNTDLLDTGHAERWR